MNNTYWTERLAETQNNLTDKNIKQIEKQLRKYYSNTMKKIVADFETVYDKLLIDMEEGKQPTTADLYKLDRYWQLQNQLKQELQKLGDKEIELLSKGFVNNFLDIYNSITIEGKESFNTIDAAAAKQIVNQVWVADGKNFSQRIWDKRDRLLETLNDNLIHCVITGKKTTELKKLLQERFKVSYNSADTIVRTELAHIQTQAAKQRYQDYGLKYYKFLADADERTCSECRHLDGKRFLLSEMTPGVNAPPMHPRDRCCIIPVVED